MTKLELINALKNLADGTEIYISSDVEGNIITSVTDVSQETACDGAKFTVLWP